MTCHLRRWSGDSPTEHTRPQTPPDRTHTPPNSPRPNARRVLQRRDAVFLHVGSVGVRNQPRGFGWGCSAAASVAAGSTAASWTSAVEMSSQSAPPKVTHQDSVNARFTEAPPQERAKTPTEKPNNQKEPWDLDEGSRPVTARPVRAHQFVLRFVEGH